MTEFLDLDDLMAAADAALGQPGQLPPRPQASAFGEEAYPTLDLKAAALLQSLLTGHSLVDGNKRLGWVAVRLFYRINGHDIRPNPDEAFDLIVEIAAGSLHDVTAIADRLASWREPGRL